jgi:hypothetical protein
MVFKMTPHCGDVSQSLQKVQSNTNISQKKNNCGSTNVCYLFRPVGSSIGEAITKYTEGRK